MNVLTEIGLLISNLSSGSGSMRERSRWKLVEIGGPAVEPLMRRIPGACSSELWEIMKTLSDIAAPESIPVLIDKLTFDVSEIRWLAAKGLIHIGEQAVVPLLQKVELEGGESKFIREGAHHVLGAVEEPVLKADLEPLLEALEDKNNNIGVPLVTRAVLKKIAK